MRPRVMAGTTPTHRTRGAASALPSGGTVRSCPDCDEAPTIYCKAHRQAYQEAANKARELRAWKLEGLRSGDPREGEPIDQPQQALDWLAEEDAELA